MPVPRSFKTILLADDDPRDRELTVMALENGADASNIVSVADGAEAMDFLMRQRAHGGRPVGNPAVILLDIRLPKLSGFEVLERVRADQGLRRIPVVMLTGSQRPEDVSQAYALGCNAYVVKASAERFARDVSLAGRMWGRLNVPSPS